MSIATRRSADLRRAALVATLLLCGGATAQAQGMQERGTQADQDACTPDVFRLCNDYVPDETQIVACLKSKRTQLSPSCGKVFGPEPTTSRKRRRTEG